MFAPVEREYLQAARVGRLGTVDAEGRPHAVPICFALAGDEVVTPIDEKPKEVDPTELRRVRNVRGNPRVALVVDHYDEDWSRLGWVQIRGTAEVVDPGGSDHQAAISALRAKYDQYEDHGLEELPMIHIEPGSVMSWGRLDPQTGR